MIAFAADAPDADIEREEAMLVAWLRTDVRPDIRLVSICSGALLAARAGLLDGHDCTTHYTCCAELAALAPRAKVLENRLYVEDGNALSSAGVTAGTDLMLHIVSRLCSPTRRSRSPASRCVSAARRGGSAAVALDGGPQPHPSGHASRPGCGRPPIRHGEWTLDALARIASRARGICRGCSTNTQA